jgi:ribose transport system permease protein
MASKKVSVSKLFSKSNNLTLVLVCILVVLVFSLLNKNYFTFANARNILYAASISGLLSIGATILIISGNIDLSSGSMGALAGVVMAILLKNNLPWVPAMIVVILVGVLVGLLNALLVNYFGLQPFIATLATSSVCEGFAYIACNGIAVAVNNKNFIFLGTGRIFGVPLPIIILFLLFLLFGFMLMKTRFGRSIYMIGGNVTAARLAGLKPKKINTILYVMSSSIGALAGIILTARMHAGSPSAMIGTEFVAITAAVLGGVAFSGGSGTLGGCFIGLLILNCFNNGLTVSNVSSFWQIVAQGMLLIVALISDFFRRRSLQKAESPNK